MNPFDLQSYDYQLPLASIASKPLEKRDTAKMLVYHRKSEKLEHKMVYQLPEYLGSQDLVVANDTKVLPARLLGKRKTGGYLELLLIKQKDKNIWECKLLNSRKLKLGEKFGLCSEKIQATLLSKNVNGTSELEFAFAGDFFDILQQEGCAPLPPYILKQRKNHHSSSTEDLKRYQTLYAQKYGSIAAPTAGLHFSKELLTKIKEQALWASITLHIGLGTFELVTTDDIREHLMHKEYYRVSQTTQKHLNTAKGKILAVGTTTARALESLPLMMSDSFVATNLFIYPSYSFRYVNCLLTNFHLPKSSLMMMVAAFCGLAKLHELYQLAIKENYRFYSYGDCMLIL